jgi:hypothetical protein
LLDIERLAADDRAGGIARGIDQADFGNAIANRERVRHGTAERPASDNRDEAHSLTRGTSPLGLPNIRLRAKRYGETSPKP